jgi:hypothetical protein
MEVKAYYRSWPDQEISAVREYFQSTEHVQSETKRYASVIINGIYFNAQLGSIMLEVRNA